MLVMGSAEEYYFTSTLPVLNRAESSHFVASQLSYETTSISVDQDEVSGASVAVSESVAFYCAHFQFHVHITMPRSNMSSLSLTYFIFLNYSLKYHSDVKVSNRRSSPAQAQGTVLYISGRNYRSRRRAYYCLVDLKRTNHSSMRSCGSGFLPGIQPNFLSHLKQAPFILRCKQRRKLDHCSHIRFLNRKS